MQLAAGLYRHYKGAEYRVLDTVRHSETEEVLVLYQALYGERGLWVRPLSMFVESVEVDGELLPRFALITADEPLTTRL
ncbi:DUF1653 domain-containing protein [Pseudomonas matsuisoli]|uniref:DUF1653 domain-containing protein n=1 Tax=Pseudomonas matsuisoli TaxID=1515666 RepID=A0A917PJR4_9PSED|nr:DUF1653 domain-containing protein [Pseudomonas matsuisoli]GGJ81396.1 hypothetical protein GCM10009304_04070 [Pseudomonas matsuisoli]